MNFVRICYKVYLPLYTNSVKLNIYKQSLACYSVDYQHRRPLKVYNPDGTEITDDTSNINYKYSKDAIKGVIELGKDSHNTTNKHRRNRRSSVKISNEEENDNFSDEEENIPGTSFVRLGDTDNTFDKRIIKVQSKKQREKSNMIMIEGKRLIQDAIYANVIPSEIFFSRKSLVEDLEMPLNTIKLYKMPYNKMKKWSPLQTPPGIVAFSRIPKNMQYKTKNAIPLTVICDNIREPGNLGTILRTIAGVGCSKVILTKGCVDLWDSKVLRSAAGAHFHIKIENDLTWSDIVKYFDKKTSIFIAHHNQQNDSAEIHSMPTVPYFSIDYASLTDIVVIIGGETEGISDEAINMARYRDGVKVNIPLDNNIESLNVGAAMSTILFEVKRQFIINNNNNENYFVPHNNKVTENNDISTNNENLASNQ